MSILEKVYCIKYCDKTLLIITIGLLRKLSNLLLIQSLVTICKAFVRPHLGYGDILYGQAFNNYFHAKWNPFNIMHV